MDALGYADEYRKSITRYTVIGGFLDRGPSRAIISYSNGIDVEILTLITIVINKH